MSQVHTGPALPIQPGLVNVSDGDICHHNMLRHGNHTFQDRLKMWLSLHLEV